MSPIGPRKATNYLRSLADRWLLLIWAILLLVLPYTMALFQRSESQVVASAILGGLTVVKWSALRRRGTPSEVSAELNSKGPFPRRARPILVFMVVISCLDVIYGVPYWSARVREAAGQAFRTPVQVAAQNIIAAINSNNDRTLSLAAMLGSGEITFRDLRPQTTGITALPSVLGRLRRALSRRNTPMVAAEVRAYSFFHILAPSLDRRITAQGALVPILLSGRFHDVQYGWVRMLGFSDGEVVEIVASPFSTAGSGRINRVRLR